jgi:hypothetical protein
MAHRRRSTGKPSGQSREMRGAHRMTTFGPGCLGDEHNRNRDRADMFVDPSPYVSLRGIHLGGSAMEKYEASGRATLAGTCINEGARKRSRGE